MNKEQVRETCTDPKTRNLIRITMNDAEMCHKMIMALMGSDVNLRRPYYEERCINID